MQEYYKFVNSPLPYSYKALEPYIDIQTMYLHHDKHLQTYVDNLNAALSDYPFLQNFSLEQLLCNLESIPTEIQTAIRNNAGGVYNHQLYFNGMTGNSSKKPVGSLAKAIEGQYGSFKEFQKEFTKAALGVFGSGYAWLVVRKNGELDIVQTANQDTPLELHLMPILNIDVWEHAYYLKHFNLRKNYIPDWFQVVDWEWAEERYQEHKHAKTMIEKTDYVNKDY